jgi:glycosyltransferase involved in cell wall biosynthesis
LLACGLHAHGVRAAHIVYPMPDGVRLEGPRPALIGRPEPRHELLEPGMVWRAMHRADAEAYVFRGAKTIVGVGAAFCRARGRRLIFSAANDADFARQPTGAPGWRKPVYDLGVRSAAAIVVQSSRQVELARQAFPGVEQVIEIPSLTEAAEPTRAPGEAFLWIGRMVEYKRPLEFVRLAAAVPEARFWMLAATWSWARPSPLHREVLEASRDLPNFEILEPVPHPGVMELIGRAAAVVNTSTTEGMPNVWLEGWSRGVPALTLEFDPDGRVAERGLGISAGGDFGTFADGARELWARRDDRSSYRETTRRYIQEVHSVESVSARWAAVVRG